MARRYESQCVSCGLPCIGDSCRNYNYRILECDSCHDEVDKLYIGVSGLELCSKCALEELQVIE